MDVVQEVARVVEDRDELLEGVVTLMEENEELGEERDGLLAANEEMEGFAEDRDELLEGVAILMEENEELMEEVELAGGSPLVDPEELLEGVAMLLEVNDGLLEEIAELKAKVRKLQRYRCRKIRERVAAVAKEKERRKEEKFEEKMNKIAAKYLKQKFAIDLAAADGGDVAAKVAAAGRAAFVFGENRSRLRSQYEKEVAMDRLVEQMKKLYDLSDDQIDVIHGTNVVAPQGGAGQGGV